MRQYIGNKFKNSLDTWAQQDPRYVRLAELDAHLDGKFYDVQPYSFYQETTSGGMQGEYVYIKDRRPSFRFNVYNMLANQTARKLFAGPHAPKLKHPSKKFKKAFEAIKQECDLESKMIEAAHWGSVGSVCTVFKIVPFKSGGKPCSKVVVTNYRAKQCTPLFNDLAELARLFIHYPVFGQDYLLQGIDTDWEGKLIDAETAYWVIQELNAYSEIVYMPIKLTDWKPSALVSPRLVAQYTHARKETGEILPGVAHDLGFVPAHWHQFRTGELKPYDGVCYWDPAVPVIIDLDYTVSQIGGGVRYNSVPQVVVKGEIVNPAPDGGMGRGAAKFLQLKPDMKEGDAEEKNNDAYMLEAKGDGMKVGLEHWAALALRIAMQQICASLTDPNKMTTAMSGLGMQIMNAEYYDLAHELRGIFGDNGYLKILKKIAVACMLKNHLLADGFTHEIIDALTFGWPPLSPIGMIEFEAMCRGLSELCKTEIWDRETAAEFSTSQIDMPIESANKDYLTSVSVKSGSRSIKRSTKKRKGNSVNGAESSNDAETSNEAIGANAKRAGRVAQEKVAIGKLKTNLGP
jgi:hypothetical protein